MPVLEVQDLSVEYDGQEGSVRAVDRVSLELDPGEFLGVVGESGCGKSTLLFAIARLLNPPARITSGHVFFQGRDLAAMPERELRSIRWRGISIVMQSAMNALNPVKTVAAQYRDVMEAHGEREKGRIATRSAEVLRLVGIDAIHLRSYPHQLSGGMRQRAMIAMALLLTPDLVIMDEPTSALDVVAQRSLMRQIKELQERLGFAVLFVTHDISLLRNLADRLAVMYAGQIAELGPTARVFDHPAHPYSRGLLNAFPSIRGPLVRLTGITGSPPDMAHLPTGCRFHPRCASVMAQCAATEPDLVDVDGAEVRCLLYRQASAS